MTRTKTRAERLREKATFFADLVSRREQAESLQIAGEEIEELADLCEPLMPTAAKMYRATARRSRPVMLCDIPAEGYQMTAEDCEVLARLAEHEADAWARCRNQVHASIARVADRCEESREAPEESREAADSEAREEWDVYRMAIESASTREEEQALLAELRLESSDVVEAGIREATELRDRIAELELDAAKRPNERSKLKQRVRTLEAELGRLRNELKVARGVLHQTRRHRDELRDQTERAEADRDELREGRDVLAARCAKLERQRDAFALRTHRVEKEFENLCGSRPTNEEGAA